VVKQVLPALPCRQDRKNCEILWLPKDDIFYGQRFLQDFIDCELADLEGETKAKVIYIHDRDSSLMFSSVSIVTLPKLNVAD